MHQGKRKKKSLYLNTKIATFTSADSTALVNLSNLCPYTNGGVVYQARALYNIMYSTFAKFTDNCALGTGSRLFDNVVKDEPAAVNVILKSKLYPNPNGGNFNIEIASTTDNKTVEVYVYDMAGKIVLYKIEQLQQNKLQLNPNLTYGTYLVKVKLPDGTFDIHRLIVE